MCNNPTTQFPSNLVSQPRGTGDRFGLVWKLGKPLASLLDATGAVSRFRRKREPRTVILAYHSISQRADLPGITTSAPSFASHLAVLQQSYLVVPMAETY
jgi:hypothetical protein